MGLSEVRPIEYPRVQQYADANGYTLVVPTIGSSLRPVLLSKYPVLFSETVDSPAGADEFVRQPVYAELDVQGERVGVYVIHTETLCTILPCDGLGLEPALEHSRAIEFERMIAHSISRRSLFPDLHFLVIGDHNDDPSSPQTPVFNSQATGTLSGGFNFILGNDISYPIEYAPYPIRQHDRMGVTTLLSTNLDGDSATVWANNPNSAITGTPQIDFIAHSDRLTVVGHEILDSEATQTGGLVKYGNPLPVNSSRMASDHKLVFADFQIQTYQ